MGAGWPARVLLRVVRGTVVTLIVMGPRSEVRVGVGVLLVRVGHRETLHTHTSTVGQSAPLLPCAPAPWSLGELLGAGGLPQRLDF